MSSKAMTQPICTAHQVVTCLVDGALIVAQDGTISSITPRCLSMIRSKEDWIGRSLWQFLPVTVLYSPCTVQSILAAFADGTDFQFESSYTHVRRWFRFCLRPAAGGMVLFLRDITEERVLAATQRREKNAAVHEVASLLAHEINNPLQALTHLLFIACNECTEPCIQQLLQSAERQLQRMDLATKEVLSLKASG